MEDPLLELQEYDDLVQILKSGKGPLQVTGILDLQKVYPMYELGEAGVLSWKLAVIRDDTRTKEIYDDLRNFTSRVWLYLAKDLLFYSADVCGNLMARQRIAILHRLMGDRKDVVITTMDGPMNHLLPLKYLREQSITMESGQVIDLDVWKERLIAMGYERMAQVDGIGRLSIRGRIMDVFPLAGEVPVCIELQDDEVDSIRTLDLESQRSAEQLENITIYPTAGMVLSVGQLVAGIRRLGKERRTYEKVLREQHKPEEVHRIHAVIGELRNGPDEGWGIDGLDAYTRCFCPDTVSSLEYFPQGESVIFLDEPIRLKEGGETVELESRENMVHGLKKGYLLLGQIELLYPAAEILARAQKPYVVMLTGLNQRLSGMKVNQKSSIDVKNVSPRQNSFKILTKDLTRRKKEGYRVILLSASRTRANRLTNDLRGYDLRAYRPDRREGESGDAGGEGAGNADTGNPGAVNTSIRKVRPGEILVTHGNLHRGFEYLLLEFVSITEGDMFNVEEKRKRRKKANYQGKTIQSFIELSVGGYVVHEEYGLGIYKGIEEAERGKVTKDHIKIEYRGDDNPYLSATRLESIQKYAGAETKRLKLNKLGETEWNKTKTRIRGAAQEIARDLVKLYAARQEEAGFQYRTDTVWQREFEELLPYDETDDQMDAIDAVKKDMESRRIMGRLICGDIGHGGTEVTLRTVFKAVQDSRQVVYLVLATILAQQRYNTFVQRMKDFPMQVDMLSRFYTPARQKGTLEDLRRGMVDTVIGTYRVLSKDMQFKDPGLLTINEEQRFGVTHKEKIKHLKENANILALTAMPTLRTLHMSLASIRDMSVLEGPPADRTPIQTYAMEYNEEMVREIINHELTGNDQVYRIYNCMMDIDEVAGHVQALVLDAVVTSAHGQIREHKLERIMADFINGGIDVLVFTTIIETGLDISNVNTMITHDADCMGLSQLYRLRGRVRCSDRTSYALLMYKRDRLLREEVEKRLQVIREFTELGSGIKITARDLEIRGMGNMLGAEQHGHMEAVGYDLYCKMLNQAVLTFKGETLEENPRDTVAECDIDAYIPGRYTKNEYQKLDIYKRISAIETEEEYMDMQDELMDHFGDIPHSVENLLRIASIRALAHQVYVTEVVISRQEVRLIIHQKAKLQVDEIPDMVGSYKDDLKLVPGDVSSFHYINGRDKNRDSPKMMGKAEETLKSMCGIRI